MDFKQFFKMDKAFKVTFKFCAWVPFQKIRYSLCDKMRIKTWKELYRLQFKEVKTERS